MDRWLQKLVMRSRSLLYPHRVENELDEELRFHLDQQTRAYLDRGLPKDEATRAARLALGGIEQQKEACRDVRGVAWIQSAVRDFQHALRLLSKRPLAAAAVVLTMAIAFASSTVIYSTIDLVQHFIPAPGRDQLVFVDSHDPRRGRKRTGVSVADFIDWTQKATTFEDLAGFNYGSVNLTGVDVPLQLSTVRTTGNFFSQWGVTPVFGRTFSPADSEPGAERVAIVTDWLWRTQLGGRLDVIGRTFVLDGVPHTVVGVLPPAMSGGIFWHEELLVPLVLSTTAMPRDQRDLFVTGRLKPGVSREQASADLQRVARQLESEYPRTNTGIGATVRPLLELVGGNTPFAVLLLRLAAGLLLVIACTNVANVLLAQLLGRRREFAVRRALGATRGQQIRQLLVESLLYSVVAGAIGLVVAYWAIDVVRAVSHDAIPFNELTLNRRVIAFAVVASALAPFAFALLPAWRASMGSFDEITHGTRGAGLGVRSGRLQQMFVLAQVAVALILLLEVGMLARTTRRFLNEDTGIDVRNVLTFRITLPDARYRDPRAVRDFFSQTLDRLSELPRVQAAAATSRLPISDRDPTVRFTIEGQPVVDLNRQPWAGRVIVTPNYLRALGIPLLRGRDFTATDRADSALVAMISQRMARRYWPDRDPIGQRIRFESDARGDDWVQVVGVVGDVRNAGAGAAPDPVAYVPVSQAPSPAMVFVVRTTEGNPSGIAGDVRRVVASVDKDQPIYELLTMEEVLSDDLRSTAVLASVLASIALVAFGLAALGIYGVVAHSVGQRTHELGIRMALGASRRAALWLVIGQAAVPVIAGAVIGLGSGLALMRLTLGALQGSTPNDIAVSGILLFVAVVTMAAMYVPARRATAIDPAVALRCE